MVKVIQGGNGSKMGQHYSNLEPQTMGSKSRFGHDSREPSSNYLGSQYDVFFASHDLDVTCVETKGVGYGIFVMTEPIPKPQLAVRKHLYQHQCRG